MNRWTVAVRVAAITSAVLWTGCAVAAPDWSGTYTSTVLLDDGFTHTEENVVSGLNVTGSHTFTNGATTGSFSWTGIITPNADMTAGTIAGSGTIDNLGVRNFDLVNSGLYLDAPNERYVLYWGGVDPLFGPIGGVSYLSITSEELLTDLIGKVMNLNLEAGISNALDSKLQNALDALDRAQAGDTASAIGILHAFIQSIDAQRGKKLSKEQANELVAAAQAIIDALSQP